MFRAHSSQKGKDMKYGRGVGVVARRSNRSRIAGSWLRRSRPDVRHRGKVALGANIADASGTRDLVIPFHADHVIVVGSNVLQRRNLSDGSLDTSFGSGGHGIADIPG